MSISDKIRKIKMTLANDITLVAVSKNKSNEEIFKAYNAGHKIFGENKVQELLGKYESMPKDIKWHMIGHLQTNKVKYIAPFIHLIHAIDSEKLLKEINKRAKQNNRIINCLLQVHIAEESTKFGFSSSDINDIIIKYSDLQNINIIGLMGMATFTDDRVQIEKEFNSLYNIYKNHANFTTLSMGMSNDYKNAIKCGSNMIRLGSLIFGDRNY
mgnify:CR=1 FL=1|tara:strand:+ start:749 stop:1387 length:639 start_codon:yes stop_codon:yes gene_type:complete